MTVEIRSALQRKLGAQSFEITNLLSYYAAFTGMGIAIGIVGPTLPALSSYSGTPVGLLGILFTVRSLGYLISSLTLGSLFDRMKAHPLLGFAQIGIGLCLAGVAWFYSLPMLIVIFSLMGALESLVSVGSNTALVWTFRERSSPLINGLHFSFGIGAFLSPLLVAQLLSVNNGFQIAYWISGGFFVLLGLWTFHLGNSPAQPKTDNAEQNTAGTTRADYILLGLTGLFLFFYVGSEVSFGGWYFTYVFSQGFISETTAAYMNSAFWLSFTIGRLLSIWVALKVPQKKVLPIAVVGSLLSISILFIQPLNTALLWISPIALGFFMAPIFPTAFSWVSQSLQLNGRLTGILFLGDSTGAMILPWLAGRVIDSAGASAMVPLIAGAMLLNLIAYFGLLAVHRSRSTS